MQCVNLVPILAPFQTGRWMMMANQEETGIMWTASAHIITTIIGSGVLSLAWGMAQLGWIAGIGILLTFSVITYYTSSLLADCYRFPKPISGK
ncbi:hypothetical protein POPTR_006G235901v4 [Populus trichocarpa]|uniref:Calmodulin-binding family protein n=1 Tax=Populus trichocarpa TaxID=3694 RepID=A0A2K2A6I9_POPTR|nr:hypothetical protein BDE02_06G205900 [Populus trichocarpa]PNT33141.2 hypothetical protein POPTR_006G235901v4 [Populus trichocarpa]